MSEFAGIYDGHNASVRDRHIELREINEIVKNRDFWTPFGPSVLSERATDYSCLLPEYEARSGEGILLNTSFNLHGEPMVYRACDAVKVVLLRYMALGNWWVERI
jgi:predicted NodU family carbamoyl transferase